jgi:hypothetical protein
MYSGSSKYGCRSSCSSHAHAGRVNTGCTRAEDDNGVSVKSQSATTGHRLAGPDMAYIRGRGPKCS